MTERRRIIEGSWTCSSCENAGIPGRDKVCPACGSAREDEEAKFDFGERTASGASKNATVDDAAALELATAGADWYCANCGTANGGKVEACRTCGSGDPDGRLAKKPEKPPQPAQAAAPPPEPPKKSGGSMVFKAIGCMFMVGVPLVLVTALIVFALAFWKSESQGTVASMKWSREIHLETFSEVEKKGWKSDIPKRASKMPTNGKGEVIGADDVRLCTKKEKTPKKCETKTKKVECGTEEKCQQKDLGNGFAEEVCKDVTKYCDEKYEECKEAVFDEWCTYDTYEWKRQDTKRASGSDGSPKWPDAPKTGALDRLVKAETYEVVVKYEGEQATFEPKTEAEFKKYAPNQAVIVEVNGLGKVTDVRPAK